MHNILSILGESQIVVDLGCGEGSFNYASYGCKIIGVDINLRNKVLRKERNGIQYVESDATHIPLRTGSIDAVICNNAFEHFISYEETLAEINRILNRTGLIWISIPNGHGFSDALYRWLFLSGGHINLFSFHHFVDEVHSHTGLRLAQSSLLFSSFIYLKRPTADQFRNHPEVCQLLSRIPDWFYQAVMISINGLTRWIDKRTGSGTSQYGWGFVFARSEVQLAPLPSYFNVCWN